MIRLFAGLLVAGSFFAVSAQQDIKIAADHVNPAPESVQPRKGFSVSSAVVDFSELAAEEAASGKKPPVHLHQHRRGWPFPERAAASQTSDTAPQIAQLIAAAAPASSPPLTTNFLGTLDNGRGVPPDTMGSVGPRHLMVTVNTEVKILTRGGQPISSVALDQFWSRVNPNGTSDPHSFFDADSGRWFIVTISDFETATASILLGASQTDDPTGRWNLYKIDADPTDVEWPDYPTLGMNSKWVVIGGNNFSNSTGAYTGAGVWVFDKQSLIQGALTIPATSFPVRSGFTLQPCITFDQNEPTLYLVENFGNNSLRISTVTGPANNPSLNVGVAFANSRLGNWNLQGGDLGFQLGDARGIDAGDPRLMNAVFRNGAIWCSHSVFFPASGAPTHAAAQWWQINPSGAVIQQGQLSDSSGNISYSYPSIGVNKNNDVLLGYTKFDSSGYASAKYSFRAGSDAINTLRGEALLKAGEASYFKDFGSGRNRWGDYSMTVVDPLNDLDLWTIQEYAASPVGPTSQWGVWWGMVLRSTPPDGILDLQVNPATLSDVAIGAPTDFFVTVSDSFESITNATVKAQIPGRPALITFRNDGVFPDVTASDDVYSATITFANASESPVVFTATAPGKQQGSITATYNIVPRPANDNFADAAKIPAGGIFGLTSAQVQNNFATTEPNEPLHADKSNFRSLWWTYSTATAAPILVDTSGSGPRVVIAVYTGNSLTSLFPVASTNPPSGKPAILKFDAQPGVTYRIVVAGADQGEKGIVRLRVQPNGEPDTAPPIIVVQHPPSGMVTNSQTVLFRGTAVDPAPQASGVRSVLIEDVQTEPANVVQATLNGTLWSANITLSQETNVFRVHGVDFADNASAPLEITIYYRPTTETTNDLFGYSRTLSGASGVDFATTTNATREFGEPLHGGNEGGASLWWTYSPTRSGVLVISTEGSDFDTLLGVYTVNDPLDRNLTHLVPIAQNDDSPDRTDGTSEVSVAVEAGRLYYIAVDGYGGETGNVRLEYNFAETAVFQLTTSSSGGGTISPGNGTFPSESAVTVTATPDRYKQFSRFIVTQNGITTIVTNGPSYTFSLSGNTQVTAEFTTKQFADDFQSGGFNRLPYQISSSSSVGQHWVIAQVETNSVTHEGSLVARVRPGLPDATTASLVVVTNLAPGIGSFEFTVNSETNYDKFEFSVDGLVLGTWSGTVPWQTFFFNIPAKSTPVRLEWRYSKDLAFTAPNELVAIDNIDIRPVAPPAAIPLTLSITADAAQVTIVATGPANNDFRLESSTDLINWSPVTDTERNSGSAGIVTYVQPAPGARRFYRVVEL